MPPVAFFLCEIMATWLLGGLSTGSQLLYSCFSRLLKLTVSASGKSHHQGPSHDDCWPPIPLWLHVFQCIIFEVYSLMECMSFSLLNQVLNEDLAVPWFFILSTWCVFSSLLFVLFLFVFSSGSPCRAPVLLPPLVGCPSLCLRRPGSRRVLLTKQESRKNCRTLRGSSDR